MPLSRNSQGNRTERWLGVAAHGRRRYLWSGAIKITAADAFPARRVAPSNGQARIGMLVCPGPRKRSMIHQPGARRSWRRSVPV